MAEAEICSNALRDLGADPITSLTDNSESGRLCNAYYTPTRDAVLRAYPWNFARKRASLSQLTASPAFEFSYQYQLPVDCLRVYNVYESTSKWIVEGDKLLSNDATMNIYYIAQIEDTSLFDSLFEEALAARLSARLAYPITGNRGESSDFMQIYDQKIREARSIDGNEGEAPEYISNELTSIR